MKNTIRNNNIAYQYLLKIYIKMQIFKGINKINVFLSKIYDILILFSFKQFKANI